MLLRSPARFRFLSVGPHHQKQRVFIARRLLLDGTVACRDRMASALSEATYGFSFQPKQAVSAKRKNLIIGKKDQRAWIIRFGQ
jgi:ABC-type polar amino acid transport system ATPase subunit